MSQYSLPLDSAHDAAPSHSAPALADPLGDREPRSRRLIKAVIESPRFGKIAATIRDLSNHGMGGKTQGQLVAGEEITISAGRSAGYPATVRWFRDGNFGLYLDDPIDLRAFLFTGDKSAWDERVAAEKKPDLVRTCYKPQSAYRPGFRSRRGVIKG